MAPTPGKSLRRGRGLLVGIVARHGRFLCQWSCEGGVYLLQGEMVRCNWQAQRLFSGKGDHCCDEMIAAATESHNACCMCKHFGSTVPSFDCVFFPRDARYYLASLGKNTQSKRIKACPCIHGRAAALWTKLFGGSCPAPVWCAFTHAQQWGSWHSPQCWYSPIIGEYQHCDLCNSCLATPQCSPPSTAMEPRIRIPLLLFSLRILARRSQSPRPPITPWRPRCQNPLPEDSSLPEDSCRDQPRCPALG